MYRSPSSETKTDARLKKEKNCNTATGLRWLSGWMFASYCKNRVEWCSCQEQCLQCKVKLIQWSLHFFNAVEITDQTINNLDWGDFGKLEYKHKGEVRSKKTQQLETGSRPLFSSLPNVWPRQLCLSLPAKNYLQYCQWSKRHDCETRFILLLRFTIATPWLTKCQLNDNLTRHLK